MSHDRNLFTLCIEDKEGTRLHGVQIFMQLLSPLQHDFYLHSCHFIQDKGASSVNTVNRDVLWLVNGLDFGLFAIDLCDDQQTQQNGLKQDKQCTYNVALYGIRVPIVVMKTLQCLTFVLLLNLHIAVNNIKPMSAVMETLVWVPFALLSK